MRDNQDREAIIQNSLGCSANKIYVGRRSVRTELYKIHLFVRQNDNILQNLKLQAWLGKGYLFLYNQHPGLALTPNDTLLDKFVDISKITTRKVFQPQPSSQFTDSLYLTVPYNIVEPKSEQFYDISLFKYGQEDMKQHYVITALNRRTDPLILRLTHINNNPRDLFFFPDALLDSLADKGGNDPFDPLHYNKDYWRTLYRKRAGYREISLPIRRLASSILSSGSPNSWGYLVNEITYKFPSDRMTWNYWMMDIYKHQINQFVACSHSLMHTSDTINVKLRPAEAKFLDIKTYYKVNNNPPVSLKFEPFPPPPIPVPLDTCDELQRGSGMFFTKIDSSDGTSCVYDIYYYNKSDSCNFFVPISAEFISNNNKDTTYSIGIGFQYINIKKDEKFQSIWLPDTTLPSTKYLGKYKAHCDSSKVIFRIGASDCYSTDTISLPCSICECSDSVKVNLAPINPMTMCRIIPLISQTKRLNSGDSCKYYGLAVTGGFSPNDTQLITGLSIAPDSVNPQPINFSTYNRWVDNPFMNIYCYPRCSYNLNFSFRNKSGDEVSNKVFSITIDNSQFPIDIDPTGILSNQCYSIQPEKRGVPSEDLHFEQEIIVDPNPTIGKANVKLNLENDLNGRLVLYTASGELIQEIHNGKLTKGSTDYQIDLSTQPSGMYIITIESDGMQYIKKFVKE